MTRHWSVHKVETRDPEVAHARAQSSMRKCVLPKDHLPFPFGNFECFSRSYAALRFSPAGLVDAAVDAKSPAAKENSFRPPVHLAHLGIRYPNAARSLEHLDMVHLETRHSSRQVSWSAILWQRQNPGPEEVETISGGYTSRAGQRSNGK